jgi:hypothetical protein
MDLLCECLLHRGTRRRPIDLKLERSTDKASVFHPGRGISLAYVPYHSSGYGLGPRLQDRTVPVQHGDQGD